jgi:addiction module RelE/StbE family toxin
MHRCADAALDCSASNSTVAFSLSFQPLTQSILSLTVLDSAATPQALDIPRYRLHPLKGEMKGLWAVTVRANWRIIFRFEGNDAFDVELIDYH